MILYLDTSALVKVYVEEEGSPLVQGLIAGASLVATSRIAYAEARAALARASREGAQIPWVTLYLHKDGAKKRGIEASMTTPLTCVLLPTGRRCMYECPAPAWAALALPGFPGQI